MRVAFAGSPPFATPILAGLLGGRHPVVGLLTPPDRPRGRGQRVERSPLVELAETRGVPVRATRDANDDGTAPWLLATGADVLLVASFGQLLGTRLLELLPQGALNVHASLLPRHRGASPVAAAIAAGDAETGISIQRMVKRLDAGPVCDEERIPIEPSETAGELTARLAERAARRLPEVLDRLDAGLARFEPQDESLATYAPRLTKESGRLDWTRSAEELARFVRAMTPWPGAWTLLSSGGGREDPAGRPPARVRILEATAIAKEGGAPGAPAGTIAAPHHPSAGGSEASTGTLSVATGAGWLAVHRIQPEGSRPMGAAEFLRGRRLSTASQFVL